METYRGFRMERTLVQDGPLRAHGCVLAVHDEASGDELFRVAAWVTDHLGRRTMTGQGTTELSVMFATASAQELIDSRDFQPGMLHRQVHGFNPMRGTETIARDRVPIGADPEPPLPTA
jgi:hypothetical protein